MTIYLHAKEKILCLLSFNFFFCKMHAFEKWGMSLRFSPVLAGAYLVRGPVSQANYTRAKIFNGFIIHGIPLKRVV